MANITTRATANTPAVSGTCTNKGSALTNAELDANFISLNDAKVESATNSSTDGKLLASYGATGRKIKEATGAEIAAALGSAVVGNATHAVSADSATTAGTAGALTNFGLTNTGANTDFNACIIPGMYRVNAAAVNAPPNAADAYGQLCVMRGGMADTITQIYAPYSSGHLYTRSGNPASVGGGGNWTSWRAVIDSASIGTGLSWDSANYVLNCTVVAAPNPYSTVFDTTVGTRSINVPAGCTRARVTAVGGGGGGGGTNGVGVLWGGNGGGGGTATSMITGLTPGASISYTVGAGGSAGGFGAGGAGQVSSFGGYVTATGGGGGGAQNGAQGGGGGGSGNFVKNGTTGVYQVGGGISAQYAWNVTSGLITSTAGLMRQAGYFTGSYDSYNGQPGSGCGAGGGGAQSNSWGGSGGAGSAGCIFIEWGV